MKKDIPSVGAILKPIGIFFRRFHTLLFFLLVSGGLFAAITVLLSIIATSSTTANSTTDTVSDSFDQTTIDRVNTRGNSAPSQPGSRPSPFVEP